MLLMLLYSLRDTEAHDLEERTREIAKQEAIAVVDSALTDGPIDPPITPPPIMPPPDTGTCDDLGGLVSDFHSKCVADGFWEGFATGSVSKLRDDGSNRERNATIKSLDSILGLPLDTMLNQGAIISSVDELDTDALPPCMKAMISAMEMGHASHQSMFMLATFLSNLGLTEQQILGVYSKSPKFDAEKASYQLKYITGEVRGTEYICPACPTIKSQGLCTSQCDVKHPLQYYRRRAKKVNKKKKK